MDAVVDSVHGGGADFYYDDSAREPLCYGLGSARIIQLNDIGMQ